MFDILRGAGTPNQGDQNILCTAYYLLCSDTENSKGFNLKISFPLGI